MPQRLTGLDAAWLYLETRTMHMHVGSVLVLDPSTAHDGTVTHAGLTAHVRDRLHLAPPLRRRLVQTPLRLDHPLWIEDPDFDLEFHIRHAALPAPGGMRELAAFTADVMSRPLDRSRPLWEVTLVEGLEDGRVALVTKTHHAVVDGVSGAELLAAILQLEPHAPPPPPAAPWVPERQPGELELVASAGLHLASTPLRALQTGAAAFESVQNLVRFGRQEREEPPPALFEAVPAPWNGALSAYRRVAFAELSLSGVKAVKNALGGTVNDVVLAAVAGSLRAYLDHQEVTLDRPLVAMVPISVRGGGGTSGAAGNHVSSMLVALPSNTDDPVERLRRVTIATRGAKEQHGALGADTISRVAEIAPAGAFALAARLYSRTRAADRHRPIWNVLVSNVPGPRIPLYCAGAMLEAIYPLGPVHEMNGLNITLFSYADTVFVGINADRDLVRDVGAVATGIVDAVDELAKAAERAAG